MQCSASAAINDFRRIPPLLHLRLYQLLVASNHLVASAMVLNIAAVSVLRNILRNVARDILGGILRFLLLFNTYDAVRKASDRGQERRGTRCSLIE